MSWPPGPSGWQALKTLGWRRELLAFTERCQREYGGVCGIRFPGTRVCLVSDPAMIERVMVHHFSRIQKWDAGHFERILGAGLLTSGGELWKRQRRLIQPEFSTERVEAYVPTIERQTEAMLGAWPRDGGIDLHAEMLKLSLKITAEALFGSDSSEIEAPIARLQEQLMTLFTESLSGFPLPLSVPTPSNLRTKRAIRELDRVLESLIGRRLSGRAPETSARDFLAALLSARDTDGSRMSAKQLRDEAMTMLLASHETTALVLTWTLWLVARNPDARSHAPEHVLSESMRLYPPVWAIGRTNLEPIDLGPHTLPPGTQIFLIPYLAHRSDAFEAPMDFRPARWADPKIRSVARGAYLPFGLGPRKCVGMHFAVREAQLIYERVLERFDLAEIPGEAPVFQASVTLRPAHGLRVRITHRPRGSEANE